VKVKYLDLAAKVLKYGIVSFNEGAGPAFAKWFREKEGRQLYRVTREFGLSLKSGVRGDAWAILEWLDKDDGLWVAQTIAGQATGFNQYVEYVLADNMKAKAQPIEIIEEPKKQA
jgi:hypothetical protein